jgi:putative endonuclease
MGVAGTRGRAGEAMAAAYLELIGYRILQRNFRLAGVEVDVLAQDRRTRVLVEVKMRSRGDYGGAVMSIDEFKRHRLMKAVAAAAADGVIDVRIDVVAIERTEDGAVLTHYRNAVTG